MITSSVSRGPPPFALTDITCSKLVSLGLLPDSQPVGLLDLNLDMGAFLGAAVLELWVLAGNARLGELAFDSESLDVT